MVNFAKINVHKDYDPDSGNGYYQLTAGDVKNKNVKLSSKTKILLVSDEVCRQEEFCECVQRVCVNLLCYCRIEIIKEKYAQVLKLGNGLV